LGIGYSLSKKGGFRGFLRLERLAKVAAGQEDAIELIQQGIYVSPKLRFS